MGVVLAALVLIGIGLLSLFARDLLWDLTQFGNQWNGRASERTDLWDLRTRVGGVIALVLGGGVLVVMIAGG